MAPLGYLNQKLMDKKCRIVVDPQRAPVVKQMFEKVAYEGWSGRKVYNWLRFDLNFHTRGNRPLTLSGVYRMLQMPIYYGPFEYPRNSGQWYQGTHEALITEELFRKVQDQLKRDKIVRENREFAFTKLFTCGMCGSGITAQEKYKLLKDGTNAKYVYYSCSKARDRNCKNKYIREEELVEELFKIIDKLNMNELGMRMKLEEEIKRFNRLQRLAVKGKPKMQIDEDDIATREYAKYVLREGTPLEKRELMGHLRSRLVLNDKKITLVEE
jgi:predicted metal-binding protein